MGIKGTEAAKEAAQMVLADDNFATLAHAVAEGRTVYDNLKKSILFILPTNGGQALVLLAAIALGLTLPITPLQILWVNMITAVTLALALAFEPAEGELMRRPPRDPAQPLLSALVLWRILFVSLLLTAASLGLFLYAQSQGLALEVCRTLAVNALVAGEIGYLFCARRLHAPAAFGLRDNPMVWAWCCCCCRCNWHSATGPPLQELFGTAALDAGGWSWVIGAGLAVLVLVELEKWLRRCRRPGAPRSRLTARALTRCACTNSPFPRRRATAFCVAPPRAPPPPPRHPWRLPRRRRAPPPPDRGWS